MPPSESVWIAELRCSDAVEQKIAHRHGIELSEIEDTVLLVAGLRARWHHHAQRGWRLLVKVRIRRTVVTVVLYPTRNQDVWNLGSAYPDRA